MTERPPGHRGDPGGCAAHPPSPGPGRRRLIAINRYFHPDHSATSQLLTDLLRTLNDRRYDLLVLTSRQTYGDCHAELPSEQTVDGIRVRRLWATRFGRTTLRWRAFDYASFSFSAFVTLLREARRDDVLLLMTDPPFLCVIGWIVKRVRRVRVINWCQDLFPETAAAVLKESHGGAAYSLLKALRNKSLKGAFLNVTVSDGMQRRLVREGLPAGSINVIHNWADGEAIRPRSGAHPLRAAWNLTNRFVLGYSGNLGLVHDTRSILRLIDALNGDPAMHLLFIGGGDGYQALRRRVAARDIRNISFRPYQPLAMLPLSLTLPDLHLVTLKAACEGLVMPSKLYGIFAAGRPVVFVGDPNGDAAQIVRSADAGLVLAPRDATGLADRIRMLRRDPQRLCQMGCNARHAYDMHFSRDASLKVWKEHVLDQAFKNDEGSSAVIARQFRRADPRTKGPQPSPRGHWAAKQWLTERRPGG